MKKKEYREMMLNRWAVESPQAQNAFLAFDEKHPLIWHNFAAIAERMAKNGEKISLSRIREDKQFSRDIEALRKENRKYNVMTMYANKLIRQEGKYNNLFPKSMKRITIPQKRKEYNTVAGALAFHKKHPGRYRDFCFLAILEIHKQKKARRLYWWNLYKDIRAHGFVVNDKMISWYARSFMQHYAGDFVERIQPLPVRCDVEKFVLPVKGGVPPINEVISAIESRLKEVALQKKKRRIPLKTRWNSALRS